MWLNLLYTLLTLLALALVMLGIHNITNVWRFMIADVAGGVLATIALHAVLNLQQDTLFSNTLLVIFCVWVCFLLRGLGTDGEHFATYEERLHDSKPFVPAGSDDSDYDDNPDDDDAENMYTFEVVNE